MAFFNGYWVIPSCCFAILISEYTKSCIITNSIHIDVKKEKVYCNFYMPPSPSPPPGQIHNGNMKSYIANCFNDFAHQN